MAVVLTILKIIGIILLIILGVVLTLLLLVLFVPVRHSIDLEIGEPAGPDDCDIEARTHAVIVISWLLKLVRATIVYPLRKDGVFQLHIAFFRLIPRKEKPEKEGRKKEKKKREETPAEAEPTEKTEETIAEETIADEAAAMPQEESPETAANGDAEEKIPGTAEEKETKYQKDNAEKPTFSERWERFCGKLEEFAQKPEIGAKNLYYTISGFCDRIRMVRVTIESTTWMRAKQLLLNQSRRVFRHIAPRKCRVRLVYGMGDPALTGDITAKMCMLYPILGDHVQFTPVFDAEVFYGEAHIRGRVRVAVLVWAFLRCYFSRDVKRLVRRFKKIREHERVKEEDNG